MIDNGRTEEICRQMDDFADEDHTHHTTSEEISDYRVNWWIRSNKIGSDTMPIRTLPTSSTSTHVNELDDLYLGVCDAVAKFEGSAACL